MDDDGRAVGQMVGRLVGQSVQGQADQHAGLRGGTADGQSGVQDGQGLGVTLAAQQLLAEEQLVRGVMAVELVRRAIGDQAIGPGPDRAEGLASDRVELRLEVVEAQRLLDLVQGQVRIAVAHAGRGACRPRLRVLGGGLRPVLRRTGRPLPVVRCPPGRVQQFPLGHLDQLDHALRRLTAVELGGRGCPADPEPALLLHRLLDRGLVGPGIDLQQLVVVVHQMTSAARSRSPAARS